MLSRDPLWPTPQLKTSDPHSPGHSVSPTAIEETPENMQGDPDAPEPVAEGNIQMEHLS
jgi:hypothetical protein